MKRTNLKRFSVTIPTYNRKELLKQALESVLMQDYSKEKFEIVVVNDGGTDGTTEYLKSFVEKHKDMCVKVINADKNYGIAHTRNLAIKNSSGEIIASIDDDCTVAKNWLKTLDNIYSSKPEVMSVGVKLINAYPENILARYFCNHHIYSMNTLHIPKSTHLKEIMEKFRLPEEDCHVEGCGAGHSSFRRIVFKEIGFYDERIPYAEDVEFNIRFRQHYKPNQIYFTNRSHVIHYYKTSYLGVLKQFFNYGKGGYHFRKIRSGILKEKTFWYYRISTMKFIIAISLYTKRNIFEFILLLFVALTTHLELLLGEAHQTIKETISALQSSSG